MYSLLGCRILIGVPEHNMIRYAIKVVPGI